MDLSWYDTLNKPPLTPAASIFPPAWTILYILIFISLVVFLMAKTTKKKTLGIVLFIVQLALNLFWSPVFFYWHNMEFAFVIIILLVLAVIGTIMAFYKISRIASLLLMPYLLWLLFATYLNWGFLMLN